MTAPKRSRVAIVVSTAVLVGGCTVTATAPGPAYPAPGPAYPAPGPAYPASSLEVNVNRPGADYRVFELPTPSPELCQSACTNEAPCLAFTYVNPGVRGPNAACWLKSAVPAPFQDSCCVSGTKVPGAPPSPPPPPPASQPPTASSPPPSSDWQGTPTTPAPPPPPPPAQPPPPPPSPGWQGRPPPPPPPGQWEPNTDRPGSDYRSYDLRSPAPEHCRDACWNEPQCRAFTYVRPGVQGLHARCSLKNAVSPARPSDCCLSGVK